mgnify:CR=1 FL=1
MLEPLTQADIVTTHPIPIYGSNFFGGGIAGVGAAMLGIVNNAPGTAPRFRECWPHLPLMHRARW